MSRANLLAALVASGILALTPFAAAAQTTGADPNSASPFGMPIHDERAFVHGLLDEFEGRLGSDSSFRWEGEAWTGNDTDRIWLKTEGEVGKGRVADGQQEIYYSRPISTYFDLQAGGRSDLDSRRGRTWAAVGVEGFAPFYFKVAAHAYASDTGHYAFKVSGSNEIRVTQRLILEPQAELNVYTRDDRARGVGAGVSDLDAGLRLRYEIGRKFAPYVGVTYEKKFGGTADLAHMQGERPDDLRVTLGLRSWF